MEFRENIKRLKAYQSARNEYSGDGILLDANENPYSVSPYNRYPDPLQSKLKAEISRLKSVETASIFIGNGSDEAIDLLLRIFCNPNKDKIMICPPSYGMYQVLADIQEITVVQVPLINDFSLDTETILFKLKDPTIKMIFLCSPNNPSGNLLNPSDIIRILKQGSTLVVLDEAYIDFCESASFLKYLKSFPNCIILQTLSKAWGMAGLRCGFAFAEPTIIDAMTRVKMPYNMNSLSQKALLKYLITKKSKRDASVLKLIAERQKLEAGLKTFRTVQNVYPSDANFLLVKFTNADGLYHYLLSQKISVRNRSKEKGCESCLRITVGTRSENQKLLKAIGRWESNL